MVKTQHNLDLNNAIWSIVIEKYTFNHIIFIIHFHPGLRNLLVYLMNVWMNENTSLYRPYK